MRGFPVDISRNQQRRANVSIECWCCMFLTFLLLGFLISVIRRRLEDRLLLGCPGRLFGRGGCSLSSRHCYDSLCNQQCYTNKILSVIYLPQTVWTLDSLGSGRIISIHYCPIDCEHDDIQVLLPILQPFLSVLYIIPARRRDLRFQKKGIPF